VVQTTTVVEPDPGRRVGILGRIRNLFRPRKETMGYTTLAPQVMQPIPMPTVEPPRADGMLQSTSRKVPLPPVKKKFQDQMGCAEDYSWVTGQLNYVHTADGAHWVVRYAPIGQEDKFGGSVVLVPTVEMRTYRDGDLVCVQGEVLKERGAPGHLGGAVYRATSISIITRADP
jgi:hypothetical protein